MCEVTLIYKKGKVLNFHKWLYNQTDGLWPEDGKGTGFVEIRPRTDKTEMPRKGEFIGEWSQLDEREWIKNYKENLQDSNILRIWRN